MKKQLPTTYNALIVFIAYILFVMNMLNNENVLLFCEPLLVCVSEGVYVCVCVCAVYVCLLLSNH